MDTTTEADSDDTEVKKPMKEVTVVQDQGFFQFDTGDTYDGYFEAKKKDKSVKMSGPGIYSTAEGDSYMGIWENDKLGFRDEVTINYADGSKYEGFFKDWSYSGPGKYCYPDGSFMKCDFLENCPVGALILTDPNGHMWLGKAEQGFAWFEPVNHYYHILEKTRDTGKMKRHHKEVHEPSIIPVEAPKPRSTKSKAKK